MKRLMLGLAPLAIALSIVLSLGLAAGNAHASGAAPAAHGGGHAEVPPINWFEFGYKDLDVYGHELEGGGAHMSPPLFMALINFAIFGFVLVWKGGPPIKAYLSARHTEIKEALEEGQRLRDEASARLAEYTHKIGGVEHEVDALIGEIRASAEEEKKRIIADAERQALAMKKTAESQVAADIARARTQLEREVLSKAVEIAEQLLRDKANATDQQRLVDSFMADLAATGAAAPTPGAV